MRNRLLRVLAALVLAFAVAPLVVVGPALAAWPTTPLTTYVGSSTPAIKAADLNSFQDAINRGFLGSYSHRGIVVDATGGASVSPVAGAVVVNRAISGTSAPTTTSQIGEVNRGTLPLCWAQVAADGTLNRGFNINSATPIGTGHYEVYCNTIPIDARLVTLATPFTAGFPLIATASAKFSGGHYGAKVFVYNTANTPLNSGFSVMVYGE